LILRKDNKDFLLVTEDLTFNFKFGAHPDFVKDYLNKVRLYYQGKGEHPILDVGVNIKEFFNALHPEVYVLPRNRHLNFVDEWEDNIGLEIIKLPFSSFDFWIDEEFEGLFYEVKSNQAFCRLGAISQLGYLVPPLDEKDKDYTNISYIVPIFPHTRWIHSLLTGVLMEIILAKNQFCFSKRSPIVLAAVLHDIATAAGGDSVMRISPELEEEKNFSEVVRKNSWNKVLKRKYDFDLEIAAGWVKGEGLYGKLLDVVDKISYTAMDCFHLGSQKNGAVRQFCLQHPLIMDVWQDVRVNDQEVYFSDAERLYNFLLLRAFEHKELLYDPRCRTLDFFLTLKVGDLYQQGIITKEDLLNGDNDWLERVLAIYFPDNFKTYISPDDYGWKKFKTQAEQEKFIKSVGDNFDHAEYIKGFNTGLDWKVEYKGGVRPLCEVINKEKVRKLEQINESIKGYCVYYKI
jgi:HD superfamily phosphohydrolase